MKFDNGFLGLNYQQYFLWERKKMTKNLKSKFTTDSLPICNFFHKQFFQIVNINFWNLLKLLLHLALTKKRENQAAKRKTSNHHSTKRTTHSSTTQHLFIITPTIFTNRTAHINITKKIIPYDPDEGRSHHHPKFEWKTRRVPNPKNSPIRKKEGTEERHFPIRQAAKTIGSICLVARR